MDEEQITINSILECLDFGLRIDEKDIQDLLDIVKKKNEIIKKQSYTNKKMRKTLKTVRKERNKQQKEIKELKDRIKEKIEWLREISDNGINAVRFAATHDDEIERIQKQKDISTMIGILQELLGESD